MTGQWPCLHAYLCVTALSHTSAQTRYRAELRTLPRPAYASFRRTRFALSRALEWQGSRILPSCSPTSRMHPESVACVLQAKPPALAPATPCAFAPASPKPPLDVVNISMFSRLEAAANKLSTEAIHITSVTHPFDSRACQVTWERDALSSRQGGPKCRLWRPLMNLVGDFTVYWNSGKTRQQLNIESKVRRRRRRHLAVSHRDSCKYHLHP